MWGDSDKGGNIKILNSDEYSLPIEEFLTSVFED